MFVVVRFSSYTLKVERGEVGEIFDSGARTHISKTMLFKIREMDISH